MRQEQVRKSRKGKTPKEEITCQSSLGHAANNCMTVIRISDGALSGNPFRKFTSALFEPAFFTVGQTT